MPVTRFEEFVFGTLMALLMVYGMEAYNRSTHSGVFPSSLWHIAFDEILLLSVIVILLQTVVGGPLAGRLAAQVIDLHATSAATRVLAISVSTVIVMCPLMSIVATLLFQELNNRLFTNWGTAVARNLPMALGWQILVAGPLTRFLFRALFARPSRS